ncbi:hypothetical protein ACH5RR_019820 [Cinchona calisaya]|uniref:Uncharacterized protein n=1 Tax=Cinchona calisaya TaxID=153742 RepID=A0ABD2ZQG5_9GENT
MDNTTNHHNANGPASAASGDNRIKIFCQTYRREPIKVLMIIGLAGTHFSREPQIRELAGTVTPETHYEESPAVIGDLMVTVRASALRFVPSIIGEWAAAPCPPKSQLTRES